MKTIFIIINRVINQVILFNQISIKTIKESFCFSDIVKVKLNLVYLLILIKLSRATV